MTLEIGSARRFRIRLADLLLYMALVAVLVSLCASVPQLLRLKGSASALTSETRIVDGKSDVVAVSARLLEDGNVIPNWRIRPLKIAVAIQFLVLLAVAVSLGVRSHLRRVRLRPEGQSTLPTLGSKRNPT